MRKEFLCRKRDVDTGDGPARMARWSVSPKGFSDPYEGEAMCAIVKRLARAPKTNPHGICVVMEDGMGTSGARVQDMANQGKRIAGYR